MKHIQKAIKNFFKVLFCMPDDELVRLRLLRDEMQNMIEEYQ